MSIRWKSAVVSITMVEAGNTDNVIPQTTILRGTARSLSPAVQDLVERRLHEVVEDTARAFGRAGPLTYQRSYPVMPIMRSRPPSPPAWRQMSPAASG